jgi:hypothetical protein
MEKVCAEWAVYGWPPPDEVDSLDDYLIYYIWNGTE